MNLLLTYGESVNAIGLESVRSVVSIPDIASGPSLWLVLLVAVVGAGVVWLDWPRRRAG